MCQNLREFVRRKLIFLNFFICRNRRTLLDDHTRWQLRSG